MASISIDQETLARVIGKSIAVSSGKGGVGKTITACNLAIHYARRGLRVGLVDLDPLSDVASLLDLYESERVLRGPGDGRAAGGGLSASLMPVFRGLEILFPFQKLAAAEASGVMEKIYRLHLPEIDGRYDVLVFDLPAGMGYEENLAWLPFMRRLVLVTNPEPTAHASAGAYAKEVQRRYPGMAIHLWHNRYSRRSKEGFHPSDVAGNYNRFVDPSERLTDAERALLHDFAFVPEDPSLDLLQGEPNPGLHVLKCMRDAIGYAHGRLLLQAAKKLGVPARIREVVVSYFHHNPRIGAPAEYLAPLGSYLNAGESKPLEGFLRRVMASALRRELMRMEDLLSDQIRRAEEAGGLFARRHVPGPDGALDREIARFLVILNRSAPGSAVMRNQGVLLLFYFSLHKLLQSKTLVSVLKGLIPRRVGPRNRLVRDRFRQIRALVEQDPEYRQRYLKAVRTMHVLVTRQLVSVAKAFDLPHLVVRDGQSRIDGRPYVKLLGAFLHETLYGGLSVIVGFDYRSAAAAFQDGAERLLNSLGPAARAPRPGGRR